MKVLAGPEFDPRQLHPQIVDFYEHTSAWRMELWSQWSPLAWPFGWALSAVFARRLQQLSLPLRPLDVSRGIESRVMPRQGGGQSDGTAWIRRLRATGETIYSGWYSAITLPGKRQPSVRVVFPLPNGSVTVFLRPQANARGDLRLSSPLGRFREDGAYLVVRDLARRDFAWVRRAPLVERFDVYVDEEDVLRADHQLRLGRLPVVRLHYRLERSAEDASPR